MEAINETGLSGYNLPTSCSKCDNEFVATVDSSKMSELAVNFYLPILRDCSLTATVDAQ